MTELGDSDFTPTSGWWSRLHGEKKDDTETTGSPMYYLTYLRSINQMTFTMQMRSGSTITPKPDGTLAHKPDSLSASKKMKDRITAMVACNMTGTD